MNRPRRIGEKKHATLRRETVPDSRAENDVERGLPYFFGE